MGDGLRRMALGLVTFGVGCVGQPGELQLEEGVSEELARHRRGTLAALVLRQSEHEHGCSSPWPYDFGLQRLRDPDGPTVCMDGRHVQDTQRRYGWEMVYDGWR